MILVITVTIISLIGQADSHSMELTLQGYVACCLFHGDHHRPHPAATRVMPAQRQSIQRGMHNEHENKKAT
jgi:hypothetical protein